ncbi:MAG: MlaD family protein [Planctomycetota bacterium]|nr:MlaD family protein [Planctomycetota bacterium]
MSTEEQIATPQNHGEIPKAVVRNAEQVSAGRLRTRLWWLTLLCVGLAAALVFSSYQTQGTTIAIHFDQGHGLKAGDTLRYRGIDVGAVQSVKIAKDLNGVGTRILLSPGNEAIAVEGSQFWIERPRLRLGQISGLDTVVGAKYVAVLPGDPGNKSAYNFEGLENPLTIVDGDSVEVDVRFPEGQGLAVGDPVRYRGISVGEVTEVALESDTEAVLVRLRLVGEAKPLARSGTQFWIERPRLDLTEVRGLETLLGGLYVALQPTSADGEPSTHFAGLAAAPPIPLRDGALEVELDAAERMGVNRGAPITYRGLEVGRVSSVDLSSDGATVKIRAIVEAEYAELVREDSRWWANGGVKLDANLGGVTIAMDSVAAWLRGGIAFGTPEMPGKRVVTGHRFVLNPEPLEEWLDWQPRIAVAKAGELELPQCVRVVARWKSMIGLYRHTAETWGIALDNGYLMVPTTFADEAEAVEHKVTLEMAGTSAALESKNILRAQHLTRIRLPAKAAVKKWSQANFGMWNSDSVLLIVNPDLPEPLALDDTRVELRTGVGLRIASGVPISDSLLGSPVVDATTGRLIGLLVKHDGDWVVATASRD